MTFGHSPFLIKQKKFTYIFIFKSSITMKNITKFLSLAMLSTMSLVPLISCSAEDIETASIIGTWMHNDTRDKEYNYITFNADGTGAKWEVHYNAPQNYQPVRETFQFTVSGSKVNIFEADGDVDVETVRVKSATKIRIDGDTYIKQQ